MHDMQENPLKGKRGLARLWNALFYSFDGLKAAYQAEAAFRQELLAALILIPVAFFLPVSHIGRALMIASIILVLIIELINSAIEAVVDRVSQERHPLSKRAKDVGSAAVLLALINAALVWSIVLLS